MRTRHGKRTLVTAFAVVLASFRLWAVPPVRFAAPINSPIGTLDAIAIVAADFNGDGIQDIADGAFNNRSLEILIGAGDGTFLPKTNYFVLGYSSRITVADFNNDKKPDLTFGGSAFLGTGNGEFVAVNIFTNTDTRHGWILGGGDGSFLIVTNNLLTAMGGALAVGDFNGDAKADLAIVNDTANLHFLLGDGTGAFVLVTNYDRRLLGGAVAIGDINGDGKADVVMATEGSSVSVFTGNGDGTFSLAFDEESGRNFYTDVELADVNGDGRLDIVSCSGGTVSVLLNQTLPAPGVNLIGEQIRMVWPAWNGFTLESTTNFSTTNTWVAVTNQPVLINDQRILTISVADGERYFRLRKP